MWVSFYTRCPSWHQRWGTRWNLSHGRHTSHHCTTAPPLSLLNLKWRSCVTLSSTFSSFYITAMHRWSKHDLKLLPQVLPATFSTFHILCSITSSERNSEKRKHLRSKNRLAVTHGFATKRQFDFSCDVFFFLFSLFTLIPPCLSSSWISTVIQWLSLAFSPLCAISGRPTAPYILSSSCSVVRTV